MAIPRGLIERLVGRSRGGPHPSSTPDAPTPPPPSEAEALVAAYLAEAMVDVLANRVWYWHVGPTDYPSGAAIAGATPLLQVACVRALVDRFARGLDRHQGYVELVVLRALLVLLARRNQPYDEADALWLLDRLAATFPDGNLRSFGYAPLPALLRGIERRFAIGGRSTALRASAVRLRTLAEREPPSAALRQVIEALRSFIGDASVTVEIEDGDDWGRLAREALASMPRVDCEPWLAVLEHAATATSPRPTRPWLKVANERITAVGEEAFVRTSIEWLGLLDAPSRHEQRHDVNRGTGVGVPSRIPTDYNATILRGLMWCCAGRDDPRTVSAVADATEASFRKVPNVGARTVKVGNAGVYALGAMAGMAGVAQLARLRQRVVYTPARKAIDEALNAAAARLGLSREDLDDLATPTFDLVDGLRRFEFPPYAAELTSSGATGSGIRWLGPDGTSRRSEPAEVRRRYPEERAELKRTADDLHKTVLAQRERLERLLLTERSWPLATWRERYLDHPLLADLTRRLIWRFERDGRDDAGAWLAGAIVDAVDRPLDLLPADTRVRLWHPVHVDAESTAAWQEWLDRHEVRQPFKQAHREIYILTDAERTTATYSNRFAAHILRQHQFRSLAQSRGWQYRLQGGFDGANEPTLDLPAWQLAVEFLVEGIDAEAGMTESGIYLHLATDRVLFRRYNRFGDVVPLAEVPPLVFTEVMRDVDLFVGVASVGADPTWRDRGPQRIRDYWEGYAFGELTAAAQTRRAVLERLIPRLAIAPRCDLEERFLVVRGDLRTYRIHLGSGNILMEPNNQYLCIVPKAGADVDGADLFLPFEGDALLATILSKALMLAADRAIKDPSITRQIGRLSG